MKFIREVLAILLGFFLQRLVVFFGVITLVLWWATATYPPIAHPAPVETRCTTTPVHPWDAAKTRIAAAKTNAVPQCTYLSMHNGIGGQECKSGDNIKEAAAILNGWAKVYTVSCDRKVGVASLN